MNKKQPHAIHLGERLRMLRELAGLTQRQIAEKLGMARFVYQRYESGQSLPRLDNLDRIATFYGVTVDGLLDRTDKALPLVEEAVNERMELAGKRISTVRIKNVLTIDEFGELIGLTGEEVRKLEAGSGDLSIERLALIEAIFGVSISFLMGYTDDPKYPGD